MIYLEQKPSPPLDRYIRMLWYARAPAPCHGRQRILPTGRVQVIVNLARDFLLDCPQGRPAQRSSPSQVVGARSIYEIVDTSDMADLIGIVFEPGGFPMFAGDAADLFSNRSVALDDVWGGQANGLRDRLRAILHTGRAAALFREFSHEQVWGRLGERNAGRDRAMVFALSRFARVPSLTTVRDVARDVGWSERRFSQVFREEVGLPPKVWCRIQRFQRAVRQLHSGAE